MLDYVISEALFNARLPNIEKVVLEFSFRTSFSDNTKFYASNNIPQMSFL